ncbi:MAG: UDP-3-O-(3-hydroxymyristoyl)glucosamine N-acyltransferase [Planctomycetota bacterium]|nr:MAG: UDP-3-O-(3-hydroxymyristoyl)glucosamine N-acyltransferase [Planctomycetota bacterium]
MPATLEELAALVGGDLRGPGNLIVNGAWPLVEAGPGDITMLDCPENAANLARSKAGAFVGPRSLETADADGRPGSLPLPAILVDDPHAAFTKIVMHFRPQPQTTSPGVAVGAYVSPKAKLGERVTVYPGAYIGENVCIGDDTTIHSGVRILPGCTVGKNVVLFPNVVLYENTQIGDRCILHAGAVIGAYGFGYTSENGTHRLSAQLGFVVIEDDVEIGANTTIDRGTYGRTVIGAGTKIDNLVMIAHNCRLGKGNIVCAQVGIAGSTTTGNYVVMAGQVGVRDHVHIGDGAVLGAMSGVINNVPAGAHVVGIPATPEKEQMLKQAALSRLPDMRRQLRQLQEAVRRLEQQSEIDSAVETQG